MSRLVDRTLFAETSGPAGPVLLGSRCADDGTVVFPAQQTCPRCSGAAVAPLELPRTGTIWSWTVQHFLPKAPFRTSVFEPYPIGYVNLGEVIVEARLTGAVDQLKIDQPVQLTWLPAWIDEDGTAVLTYAFAPTSQPKP